MKKIILSIVVLLYFKICLSQALFGKVEYQRSQQQATIIELPYSEELVEAAIKDHFSKKGSKVNESKGFMLFKNVQFVQGDPAAADLYFKVEPKSRREKNLSVVYLVVAKQDENVATRSGEDNYGMDQAKTFLNQIGPSVDSYGIEMQIKAQEETIKKTERRYNDLIDNGQELEKRKKNLEEKIQENKQDQEKQKSEIEKQKVVLETLVAKRKV